MVLPDCSSRSSLTSVLLLCALSADPVILTSFEIRSLLSKAVTR